MLAAEIVGLREEASRDRVRDESVVRFESDLGPWRVWRREQQRANLLVEIAQSGVMSKQGIIDLSKTLGDGLVGAEFLAHAHEGTNDVDAHDACLGAVEDIGCLQRAMFRERERSVFAMLAASGL